MAFQTAGARHTASFQGKPRNLAEHFLNPRGTLWSVEPLWNPCGPQSRPGPSHSLAEPRGTLKPSWNLTSNHPGPPRSPRRTSWNPARTLVVEPSWNLTLQNLVEPWCGGTSSWNLTSTTDHPAVLAEPGVTLVEPGGTLVEPYLKPPQTTPQPSQNLVEPWWNPGGTLVEPWWNLGGTRGTLVEPSLKPPRTTPQPSQMVEPWWNPGGTLVEPYLRAAPDHPKAFSCWGTRALSSLQPKSKKRRFPVGGPLKQPPFSSIVPNEKCLVQKKRLGSCARTVVVLANLQERRVHWRFT